MKKRVYAFIYITIALLIIFNGFDNIEVNDMQYVPEPIIEKPQVDQVSILAVGDIMFHMPQITSAKTDDGYNFSNSFKYVQKHIEDSDLALANFETVVGNHNRYSGFPRFNSPTETVKAMYDIGFDILSTANNHSIDQGVDGIISTIDTIQANGLENIGTYKDEQRTGLIKEVNNIKLGLLSYTYGLNGLESLLSKDRSYMVNLIDEELIKADIDELDTKVDMTIVFIHWGNEYQRQPSDYQKELGGKMIEWGADIILGSHPHVIQKAEVINYEGEDKYIIYSMGNFFSNQREETMGNSYTEDGIMVSLNIQKEDKAIIKGIEYIPTWVHRYSAGNKFAYEILPVEEVLSSNNHSNFNKRLEQSLNDTLATLNISN